MIQYEGGDKYLFWNENNQKLELTKKDIETIVEFAEENSDFMIAEKIMSIGQDRDFWRTSYKQLLLDINHLEE